jgi:hypothetical protein
MWNIIIRNKSSPLFPVFTDGRSHKHILPFHTRHIHALNRVILSSEDLPYNKMQMTYFVEVNCPVGNLETTQDHSKEWRSLQPSHFLFSKYIRIGVERPRYRDRIHGVLDHEHLCVCAVFSIEYCRSPSYGNPAISATGEAFRPLQVILFLGCEIGQIFQGDVWGGFHEYQ